MSDLIASYYVWSILSVFNFWFFPVFLHFWASIKSKFHTLISFTWKLLIQPFTQRLSFDVKLCSLWSVPLSYIRSFCLYLGMKCAWWSTEPCKGSLRSRENDCAGSSWSAPPHCDWNNSKPPHHTDHSLCTPRWAAFPGADTGTTMDWVSVSGWGDVAILFNSCCILKQVRDLLISWLQDGVLPKWVYRCFQQSSLCLLCAMVRCTPIPGCFLIGMAVQTVSTIPWFPFPLAIL